MCIYVDRQHEDAFQKMCIYVGRWHEDAFQKCVYM